MLVSHAEPMLSISPTGAFLNALWPRAGAMTITAAEGLLQARSGLGGHAMARRFEKTRMSLHVGIVAATHQGGGLTHAQATARSLAHSDCGVPRRCERPERAGRSDSASFDRLMLRLPRLAAVG